MAAEWIDAPTANSIDATSDRDFAIEFAGALSMLALHLSPLGRRDDFVLDPAYGFVQVA